MQRVDKKQCVHSVIGLVIMFCGWFIPPVAPVTEVGMQLAGIFCGLVYLWSTVGMLWPSLLGIVAMLISDYADTNTILAAAFAHFGVWTSVFMMAVFGVVEHYGVTAYITRYVLTRKVINGRPWVFTFVWFFAIWLLSILNIGVAVIFMFWSLTYKLAEDLGYRKGDAYINMMLFGTVIVNSLGGGYLPFMPWVVQISGIWQSMNGVVPFTYGQHLIMATFISILTMLGYTILMRFVFKVDVTPLKKIDAHYFDHDPLPPMNWLQKFLLAYIVLIIAVMFIPSLLPIEWTITRILQKMGTIGISMVIFAVLCMIRQDGKSIINFQMLAGSKIIWDLVFLLCCVMAISSALTADVTGVKPFLSGILAHIFNGMSGIVFFAVLLAVCLVLTNFANNAVIALLLLSITSIMVASMDLPNVGYVVTMLAFGSQIAYLIPGSSIYGAVAHGCDWLEPKFIYKMTVIVVAMVYVFFMLGWPLSLLIY